MIKKNALSLALLLSLTVLGDASAQQGAAEPTPITAAMRHDVITALGNRLQAKYVFPDVAKHAITAIDAKDAKGGYAAATTIQAFATVLTTDLQTLGKDGHFQVRFDPGFKASPEGPDAAPSKEDMARELEFLKSVNYGLQRIERLPGNVGYIELRGFGPTEYVADAYNAAIELMSGTDALIIDLRRNGGGDPGSVAQWMSHFFAVGDERHLNDIYTRPTDQTQQFWTNRTADARYEKPVYVLTSGRTFSGGEECAYDFQTQKRATLVGETTGGGANPGDVFPLSHDFVAFIPTGKAINPITHSNWEHVGVKPDIAVPAAEAQKTAHAAALRARIANVEDGEEKNYLQLTLAGVESGKVEPPNYDRHP